MAQNGFNTPPDKHFGLRNMAGKWRRRWVILISFLKLAIDPGQYLLVQSQQSKHYKNV